MSNHGMLYPTEWEKYRRRRNRIGLYTVAEFLLFIPFQALVATVERRLFLTDQLTRFVMIIWMTLYIFTGSRLRVFPCPRCKRNFFGGFFATSATVFGNKCAYCGLKKWA